MKQNQEREKRIQLEFEYDFVPIWSYMSIYLLDWTWELTLSQPYKPQQQQTFSSNELRPGILSYISLAKKKIQMKQNYC